MSKMLKTSKSELNPWYLLRIYTVHVDVGNIKEEEVKNHIKGVKKLLLKNRTERDTYYYITNRSGISKILIVTYADCSMFSVGQFKQ